MKIIENSSLNFVNPSNNVLDSDIILELEEKSNNLTENVIFKSLVSKKDLLSEKEFEYNSSEGKKLIEEYKIEKIPVLLLSDGLFEYPELVNNINTQIGLKQINNTISIETPSIPFRDTNSNEIKGLVKVLLLNDESCNNCYDVNIHLQILNNLGIFVSEKEEINISSERGQKLIEDYNISKIPTILVSPNAKEYPNFENIWSQVGSIEEDDWFVFRNLNVLGANIVFKDLTSENIINN